MSEQVKDGGAAFPHGAYETYPKEVGYWEPTNPASGMTLRDWFAGQALAGVIDVCRHDTVSIGETRYGMFASKAYDIADAMLAARAGVA
jgi:hypothetical protein